MANERTEFSLTCPLKSTRDFWHAEAKHDKFEYWYFIIKMASADNMDGVPTNQGVEAINPQPGVDEVRNGVAERARFILDMAAIQGILSGVHGRPGKRNEVLQALQVVTEKSGSEVVDPSAFYGEMDRILNRISNLSRAAIKTALKGLKKRDILSELRFSTFNGWYAKLIVVNRAFTLVPGTSVSQATTDAAPDAATPDAVAGAEKAETGPSGFTFKEAAAMAHFGSSRTTIYKTVLFSAITECVGIYGAEFPMGTLLKVFLSRPGISKKKGRGPEIALYTMLGSMEKLGILLRMKTGVANSKNVKIKPLYLNSTAKAVVQEGQQVSEAQEEPVHAPEPTPGSSIPKKPKVKNPQGWTLLVGGEVVELSTESGPTPPPADEATLPDITQDKTPEQKVLAADLMFDAARALGVFGYRGGHLVALFTALSQCIKEYGVNFPQKSLGKKTEDLAKANGGNAGTAYGHITNFLLALEGAGLLRRVDLGHKHKEIRVNLSFLVKPIPVRHPGKSSGASTTTKGAGRKAQKRGDLNGGATADTYGETWSREDDNDGGFVVIENPFLSSGLDEVDDIEELESRRARVQEALRARRVERKNSSGVARMRALAAEARGIRQRALRAAEAGVEAKVIARREELAKLNLEIKKLQAQLTAVTASPPVKAHEEAALRGQIAAAQSILDRYQAGIQRIASAAKITQHYARGGRKDLRYDSTPFTSFEFEVGDDCPKKFKHLDGKSIQVFGHQPDLEQTGNVLGWCHELSQLINVPFALMPLGAKTYIRACADVEAGRTIPRGETSQDGGAKRRKKAPKEPATFDEVDEDEVDEDE